MLLALGILMIAIGVGSVLYFTIDLVSNIKMYSFFDVITNAVIMSLGVCLFVSGIFVLSLH